MSRADLKRPTWKLVEVKAYGAECPHCGYDLLRDDDYACWVQPEGVEASLEGLDFCPKCYEPVSEDGWELRDEAEAEA